MRMPVVLINASSKGSINFLNLAREFLKRNGDEIAAKAKVSTPKS
jgi:chromosome partitioning protein